MQVSPENFIADGKALEQPQRELLERARAILGSLVGSGLSVELNVGWFINLRVFRSISVEERLKIEKLVTQYDVPIALSEQNHPPRLFAGRREVGHLTL